MISLVDSWYPPCPFMTVNGQMQQFWPENSVDTRYSDPPEIKKCHQTEEVMDDNE